MIDAKNKFREGFVMTTRPFKFANLKNPIQKFTILWAYSEQPIIKKELTESALNEIDNIHHQSHPLGFFDNKQKEEWLEKEIENVLKQSKSYNKVYKGEIVQTHIDGELVRLYPGEYNIIDNNKLTEIMSEDGYHAVLTKGIVELKDFKDKQHYLLSRGVSRHVANKWASMGFKELVYYKPYYELLNMFCNEREIYSDTFYRDIEGITMEFQMEREEKSLLEKNLPNNFLCY